MRALKVAPMRVGQVRRDQPVLGLALGRHRAPLGPRNAFGDVGQRMRRRVRQAARAEIQGANQRAMDDEVGVAADRRGEVGVAAQVEAEVPIIFMGVLGLRLGAKNDFVDKPLGGLALRARKNTIEVRGAHMLALGELDPQRRQELAELAELLHRWRVVGAVDQRRKLGFQRLGGGDVGQNHEFLDQPMRIEPLGPSDTP